MLTRMHNCKRPGCRFKRTQVVNSVGRFKELPGCSLECSLWLRRAYAVSKGRGSDPEAAARQLLRLGALLDERNSPREPVTEMREFTIA